MVTSNESTGQWWSDLPLYAEGIPASLSVKQVIAKVKKILATCGLGYDKPLANYDPNTQSWKMSEGIFHSGEQPSLPILPPSGMTRNGALFQQPAWVPITDVIGSSSWPTPRSSSAMNEDMETLKERLDNGTPYKSRLEEAVAMWPTPTAVTRPMEGNVRLYRAKVQAGQMTEAEAQAILGKSVWEAQGKLKAQWPTPTSSEHKYRLRGSSQASKNSNALHGGKLNPTWVEWLMGFPTGWTDLED